MFYLKLESKIYYIIIVIIIGAGVLHYGNNIKLTPAESPVDLSLSLTIVFLSFKNTKQEKHYVIYYMNLI